MTEKLEEKRNGAEASPAVPARITLLYESRDGKLCLFEDAKGHLFAVRSSLLV